MESLPDDSVVAGFWAPVVCIDTPKKALISYSVETGVNFWNLRKIRPDFYVIAEYKDLVKTVDVTLYQEFKQTYPGVLNEPPILDQSYGGRVIKIYKLTF
jgi:hypothetical protein